MALRERVHDVVRLLPGERVIGVVLEREIQNGVKVRPTNVTATISVPQEDHDFAGLTVAANVLLNSGNANFHAVTLNFPASDPLTSTNNTFTTGELVRIIGLPSTPLATGSANLRFHNIDAPVVSADPTAGANGQIVVNISNALLGFSGSQLYVRSNIPGTNILISDLEDFNEHDYILLHNGPAGGFKQEFVAEGIRRPIGSSATATASTATTLAITAITDLVTNTNYIVTRGDLEGIYTSNSGGTVLTYVSGDTPSTFAGGSGALAVSLSIESSTPYAVNSVVRALITDRVN